MVVKVYTMLHSHWRMTLLPLVVVVVKRRLGV